MAVELITDVADVMRVAHEVFREAQVRAMESSSPYYVGIDYYMVQRRLLEQHAGLNNSQDPAISTSTEAPAPTSTSAQETSEPLNHAA